MKTKEKADRKLEGTELQPERKIESDADRETQKESNRKTVKTVEKEGKSR